eukprot:Sspe_Gene.106362::Locus_84059_Transcript_1_1_Confidence_1.000_Length_1042::g.106362::m.106362
MYAIALLSPLEDGRVPLPSFPRRRSSANRQSRWEAVMRTAGGIIATFLSGSDADRLAAVSPAFSRVRSTPVRCEEGLDDEMEALLAKLDGETRELEEWGEGVARERSEAEDDACREFLVEHCTASVIQRLCKHPSLSREARGDHDLVRCTVCGVSGLMRIAWGTDGSCKAVITASVTADPVRKTRPRLVMTAPRGEQGSHHPRPPSLNSTLPSRWHRKGTLPPLRGHLL